MILSSCGCKVSWALRGGMRLLRKPLRLSRLAGGTHSLKIRRGQQSIRNIFLLIFSARWQRDFETKIPLPFRFKICGFFHGAGYGVGLLIVNYFSCLPATGAWHALVTAPKAE